MPLIKLQKICKSFPKQDKKSLLVLDNIDMELKKGEIVALVGKSGSGKSTLLRIIAGLIRPTTGNICYQGTPIDQPVPGISMVFQSFALMPWLTVLQNVELGLEAQGISAEERRKRSLKAIDMIGLDGFESAFPKELSGGMRQRVGFARALVVNPDILLMDEPFSALDVLTTENLRGDLLDLWLEHKIPIKSIFLVTHDITEAAIMADRIIVFNSNPGSIHAELEVEFPYPRNPDDPKVRELIDSVYTILTSPERDLRHFAFGSYQHKIIDIKYPLPPVVVSVMIGLIEEIVSDPHKEIFHLQDLSESLHMDIEDLFPVIELLDMLHFAEITDGEIKLTKTGKSFADADILDKKEIFAQHLMRYIPLVKDIRDQLDAAEGHSIPEEHFLNELDDNMINADAKNVLKTVIDWGRYAEIFAYNGNTRMLSLENPA